MEEREKNSTINVDGESENVRFAGGNALTKYVIFILGYICYLMVLIPLLPTCYELQTNIFLW